MGLHTVSPGFKQYQTDLLPAARLPGKKCCLDQDQPVTQKQGPYCGVLKWVFFPFVNPICKCKRYHKYKAQQESRYYIKDRLFEIG